MKAVHGENKPRGHYSPGIISRGMLYISGQTSALPATGFPPEEIEEETLTALTKLESVLKAAQCTRENVVMCRIYLSSMEYWDDVNKVYSEFFAEHKPARIVLPVGELTNGCNVELEAVAEVD
ncbi:RidA family protein [Anaerosphaera multitolerans]|uniref:RidA family protein n=1 Tax=Anaerosphaera multitolerans TaxID=2487351 RepID=A0A437S4M2_9FIRM|nr:RidA family protein [Anaerosphaera multitolerans]RVU53944.1 RidA family protein [Anaerosphaera multitolerans]